MFLHLELQEMLKYSKGCDGADDLQQALTSILGILKAVNDSMHLIAITGYEVKKIKQAYQKDKPDPGDRDRVVECQITTFWSSLQELNCIFLLYSFLFSG